MPYSIFVVEDHPIMRACYQMLVQTEPDLQICGEAESAEVALTSIPDLNPDLVVIDLSLPGMSGLDLLAHLRIKTPDLRTLVVTGHSGQHYLDACRKAGTHGYVTKGDIDQLMTAIREILGGSSFFEDTVPRPPFG